MSCFVGLLAGCSKEENNDNVKADVEVTNASSQGATTDSTPETTLDATVQNTEETTTEESTEAPTENSDSDINVSNLNLSGLYCGDEYLIITDDNKMVSWESYDEEAKIYDIISVDTETEMTVDEALFDTTYRITGKSTDGEEFIVCTDGRLLRDYNYNEEFGYVHNTFALDHVAQFSEYDMEMVPSNVTVPTFNDEIEGIELDADIHAEVCGVYYTAEGENEDGEMMHESAFKISEEGYIYEWDNHQTISPDGQWHKYQIVRLKKAEGTDYKWIYIDTRYKTYEFFYYAPSNSTTLSGNYEYGFYVVECQKVDELPSSVPVLE